MHGYHKGAVQSGGGREDVTRGKLRHAARIVAAEAYKMHAARRPGLAQKRHSLFFSWALLGSHPISGEKRKLQYKTPWTLSVRHRESGDGNNRNGGSDGSDGQKKLPHVFTSPKKNREHLQNYKLPRPGGRDRKKSKGDYEASNGRQDAHGEDH